MPMSEKNRAAAEAAAALAASREDGRVNGAPPVQSRGWLRLHLSTAIVLMFVAAFLLWLNVAGVGISDTDRRNNFQPNGTIFTYYGWPWFSCSTAEPFEPEVVWRAMLFNLFISGAILCAVAFGVECFSRRCWPFRLRPFTALVLSVVFSTLIGLNLCGTITDDDLAIKWFPSDLTRFSRTEVRENKTIWTFYGWPLHSELDLRSGNVFNRYWASWRLLLNVAACISVLSVATFGCEFLLRRRKRGRA